MMGKQSNPFEFGEVDDLQQALEVSTAEAETTVPLHNRRRLAAKPPNPKPQKSWVWLVAFGICCVFGGIGGAAFWWLTTPPPSPDCKELSPIATDMEKLLCAQESARSGDVPKILAGLELLSQWTPDHPLYREAQRLIAEWSDPILAAARAKIDQSDLRGAVELASRIPKTSPLYKEAQAAIADWKRYWQKGEAIAKAARTAMKAQNWALANEKILLLKDFSQTYWRLDRANALSQLVTAEQQGRRLVAQAIEIAKTQQPAQLGAAIARLSQVDTRTYAWAEAQPSLKQWSETLLTLGFQHWMKGDLNQAMALATPVLKNPNLAQTAQELLWLSQARKHAIASTVTLKPTLPQLWNLSAAISTAQLIPPSSRYYNQAQTNLKNWQAQFQDLTLLQLAWGIGDVPQASAKQFAIWQAGQVTPERPRRAQAQTLISYWNVGIRKLEDQPYLLYARQLAEKATIPAYRAAIAQAQLITLNRPLQKEAQLLIANWTQKIQVIEDQPILDRAWALANQGDLNSAIQVAAGIGVGRALYWEAQSAIGNWQATIRATELARQREQEAAAKARKSPFALDAPASDESFVPNDAMDGEPAPDGLPAPNAQPPQYPYAPPATINPPPASIYPPGTEPPPIPAYPAPYAPYEPAPTPKEPPPPPLVQPFEPVPPPPSR
ncbi:MAG: hypothetical protein IGS48_07980 [Oscillatoriales cyanobacterium C42_A2020_001]|nr:hypothetical protein [Leptolyngbyaceae cyanobacterium C42_A2020_001]